MANRSPTQSSNGPSAAESGEAASDSLWSIADQFRAWVVRDLEALPNDDRASFRGDYLFIIDGAPRFLVAVTPETVSSGRWLDGAHPGIAFDLGAPLELEPEAVAALIAGQVRVTVTTETNTLRRLLHGNLRAKVAYLSGLVKISGDLPCFMRLVAVLKGRGVGPLRSTAPDASVFPVPHPKR